MGLEIWGYDTIEDIELSKDFPSDKIKEIIDPSQFDHHDFED